MTRSIDYWAQLISVKTKLQLQYQLEKAEGLFNLYQLLTLSLALLLDFVELDSPRILGAISFIGFASSILTIFSFFDAMSQPPKNTVDDVMKLLRTEMKEVKEQINKIEKRLTEQEIYLYQNVEDAVSDAINDYIFQSHVDLPSRAVKLYDRLETFMSKGMLGQGTLSADLMKTLVDLYDVIGLKYYYLNYFEKISTLLKLF